MEKAENKDTRGTEYIELNVRSNDTMTEKKLFEGGN